MKTTIVGILIFIIAFGAVAQAPPQNLQRLKLVLPRSTPQSRRPTPIYLADGRALVKTGSMIMMLGADRRWTVAPAGIYKTRAGQQFAVSSMGVLLDQTKPAIQPGQLQLSSRRRKFTPAYFATFRLPVRPLILKPVMGGFNIQVDNTTLQIGPGDDAPVANNKEMTEANQKWGTSSGVFYGANYTTDTDHKTLLMKTDPKVVKKAVWQISALPFDFPGATDPGRTWRNPPGLIVSGNVPSVAPSGINQFRVPFGLLTLIKMKSIRDEAFKGTPVMRIPPLIAYMRVVPLNAGDNLAGAPSNAVLVNAVPTPEFKSSGPPRPITGRLSFRILSFTPAANVDMNNACGCNFSPALPPEEIILTENISIDRLFKMIPPYVTVLDLTHGGQITPEMAKGLGILLKGTRLHLDWSPPSEDVNFWTYVDNFVGDFVSNPVDTFANAYNGIKEGLVSGLGNVLPGPLAEIVVDTALTAVGIPPSMPNFDKVERMGINYVTDMAFEQITGVPDLSQTFPVPGVSNATEAAINESKKRIETGVKSSIDSVVKTEQGGQPGKSFIIPPEYNFQPPVLMVEAKNFDSVPSAGESHEFSITSNLDPTELNTSNRVFGTQNGLTLWTKIIHVPPLQPGETIQIPVVLNFSTQDKVYQASHKLSVDEWWGTYTATGRGNFFGGGSMLAENKLVNEPW